MKTRLFLSIAFLAVLMYLTMGHMVGLPVPHIFHGTENLVIFSFTQFFLTLPIVFLNRKFFCVGTMALLAGAPNMDTLVAFVGDGINDSTDIAADIGIAVGSGADIAIDSADAVLMKSGLEDIPAAVKFSKETMRNIKQNLFWAFFYNTLGIPVAAGALSFWGITLSPMIGAAAMSLSSLFVVSNALRLRTQKNCLNQMKNIK